MIRYGDFIGPSTNGAYAGDLLGSLLLNAPWIWKELIHGFVGFYLGPRASLGNQGVLFRVFNFRNMSAYY